MNQDWRRTVWISSRQSSVYKPGDGQHCQGRLCGRGRAGGLGGPKERSFRGKDLGVCLRQGQIIPHLSLVHTCPLPRITTGFKVKVLGLRTAPGVWEFRWSLNSTPKNRWPYPSLLWFSSGVTSSRKPSLTISLS